MLHATPPLWNSNAHEYIKGSEKSAVCLTPNFLTVIDKFLHIFLKNYVKL